MVASQSESESRLYDVPVSVWQISLTNVECDLRGVLVSTQPTEQLIKNLLLEMN